MTLATIMKLALRQLDEADADISEHEELFRNYANMGYMIALRMYYRPRQTLEFESDVYGNVELNDPRIRRIIEVRDQTGRSIPFSIDGDGRTMHTGGWLEKVWVLCEYEYPAMKETLDVPVLPEFVHPALADYICYRYLSCGSLAKQSRAEFFRDSFYEQMRAIMPQGTGSVTKKKNLYQATN